MGESAGRAELVRHGRVMQVQLGDRLGRAQRESRGPGQTAECTRPETGRFRHGRTIPEASLPDNAGAGFSVSDRPRQESIGRTWLPVEMV